MTASNGTGRTGRRPAGWGTPIGVGVGVSLGLTVGTLLDQVALGLSVGAALGLVAGATLTTAADVPAPRRRVVLGTALALLVAGLVASLVVLLR